MKKYLSLLILSLFLFSLAACTSPASPPASTAATTVPPTANVPRETQAAVKIPQATVPSPVLESSGTLGNYSVEIMEHLLFTDRSGAPSILIFYSFTNNSQEPASALINLTARAYQNGLELVDANTFGMADYDFDLSSSKIQPGVTVQIPVAYRLYSDTSPVEFYISESFSLQPKSVAQTFVLSEDCETVLSQAPQGVMDFDVDCMHLSVISYRIAADYNGKPALVLELGVTNNGTRPESFSFSVDLNAYQNGIELDSAYSVDGVEGFPRHAHLLPGAGASVFCCFLLSDNSPVTFELSPLISFSDDAQTFILELE